MPGRSKTADNSWARWDRKVLFQRVKDNDVECTCPRCNPAPAECCKKHARHNFEAYQKGTRGKVLQRGSKYDLMTLADIAVRNMDLAIADPSEKQKVALSRFRLFMDEYGDELDAEKCQVPSEKMKELIKILSDLFFFGELHDIDFEWKSDGRWGHSGIYDIEHHRILLSATVKKHLVKGQRRYTTIGVLVHEMDHAYLETFGCQECPTWDDTDGYDGHGRAWQIIAAKVEQIFPVLFGMPVYLLRFDALMNHVSWYEKLPSLCDLTQWSMLPSSDDELDTYWNSTKAGRSLAKKFAPKKKAKNTVAEADKKWKSQNLSPCAFRQIKKPRTHKKKVTFAVLSPRKKRTLTEGDTDLPTLQDDPVPEATKGMNTEKSQEKSWDEKESEEPPRKKTKLNPQSGEKKKKRTTIPNAKKATQTGSTADVPINQGRNLPRTRRQARGTQKKDIRYNQNWHPMDDYTRPKMSKKMKAEWDAER